MPALDFWDAYSVLRSKFCPRPEEVAVGVEVSVHTVRSWDKTANDSDDEDHKRNPSFFNRVRLSRLAETKGAPKRVVDALRPAPDTGEARA